MAATANSLDELRARSRILESRRLSPASRLRSERVRNVASAAAAATINQARACNPSSPSSPYKTCHSCSGRVGNADGAPLYSLSLADPCFSAPSDSDLTLSPPIRVQATSRLIVKGSGGRSGQSQSSARGRALNRGCLVAETQLLWHHDLAESRRLTSRGGQPALRCAATKSNQLGCHQAEWVGSLRRRAHSAPSLPPMPVHSEFVRSGGMNYLAFAG